MPSRHIAISFTLASAAIAALVGTSVTGCGSDNKSSGSSDSAAQVQQGQQAVMQFACTSCHGANLAGMTTAMSGAYPANITPDPTTGIGNWSTATIVNAILNGVDDENQMLCVMPKFGTTPYNMTADQANAIAAYLKSIPAVSQTIPDSTCSAM
ncbi:MAG TPA: cytochrome c [Polyangiaceae bacterium]|nr:cytochrome c [Polyangiaceae bacterium]